MWGDWSLLGSWNCYRHNKLDDKFYFQFWYFVRIPLVVQPPTTSGVTIIQSRDLCWQFLLLVLHPQLVFWATTNKDSWKHDHLTFFLEILKPGIFVCSYNSLCSSLCRQWQQQNRKTINLLFVQTSFCRRKSELFAGVEIVLAIYPAEAREHFRCFLVVAA